MQCEGTKTKTSIILKELADCVKPIVELESIEVVAWFLKVHLTLCSNETCDGL